MNKDNILQEDFESLFRLQEGNTTSPFKSWEDFQTNFKKAFKEADKDLKAKLGEVLTGQFLCKKSTQAQFFELNLDKGVLKAIPTQIVPGLQQVILVEKSLKNGKSHPVFLENFNTKYSEAKELFSNLFSKLNLKSLEGFLKGTGFLVLNKSLVISKDPKMVPTTKKIQSTLKEGFQALNGGNPIEGVSFKVSNIRAESLIKGLKEPFTSEEGAFNKTFNAFIDSLREYPLSYFKSTSNPEIYLLDNFKLDGEEGYLDLESFKTILGTLNSSQLEGFTALILSKMLKAEEFFLPKSETFEGLDVFLKSNNRTIFAYNCKLKEGNRNSKLLTYLESFLKGEVLQDIPELPKGFLDGLTPPGAGSNKIQNLEILDVKTFKGFTYAELIAVHFIQRSHWFKSLGNFQGALAAFTDLLLRDSGQDPLSLEAPKTIEDWSNLKDIYGIKGSNWGALDSGKWRPSLNLYEVIIAHCLNESTTIKEFLTSKILNFFKDTIKALDNLYLFKVHFLPKDLKLSFESLQLNEEVTIPEVEKAQEICYSFKALGSMDQKRILNSEDELEFSGKKSGVFLGHLMNTNKKTRKNSGTTALDYTRIKDKVKKDYGRFFKGEIRSLPSLPQNN